jgi:hypothetical protein
MPGFELAASEHRLPASGVGRWPGCLLAVPVGDNRVVLRALAEVRDTDFYDLWVLLTRTWPQPRPRIEFRIYKVAGSSDARVVVPHPRP